MRIKIFGLMGFALLVGCVTPPPPPAPGSAASKVVAMGTLKNVEIGAMRVARENGFLTVKAALSNTSSSNTTLYYRFAWLGNDASRLPMKRRGKARHCTVRRPAFWQALHPCQGPLTFVSK